MEIKQRIKKRKDLTEKQVKLLEYIAAGWNDEEIAAQMNIKMPTVRFNLSKIYDKTGTCNRPHLVAWAFRNSIIQ